MSTDNLTGVSFPEAYGKLQEFEDMLYNLSTQLRLAQNKNVELQEKLDAIESQNKVSGEFFAKVQHAKLNLDILSDSLFIAPSKLQKIIDDLCNAIIGYRRGE